MIIAVFERDNKGLRNISHSSFEFTNAPVIGDTIKTYVPEMNVYVVVARRWLVDNLGADLEILVRKYSDKEKSMYDLDWSDG